MKSSIFHFIAIASLCYLVLIVANFSIAVAFDLTSHNGVMSSGSHELLMGGVRDNHHVVPVPGSVYQSALILPVIGKQIFQLNIFERKRAQLTISGVMSVDAIVDYDVCEDSGNVSFDLPENVVAMLRRFRTKLVEAYYEPSSDLVRIKVRPPLPKNINLKLSRQ